MQGYDALYQQPGYYWGRKPNQLSKEALGYFPPEAARGKKAIDLGAGEGRDAICMARHGFRVVAMDTSLPGLEKAARWASVEGLTVETVRASLLDFRLSETYDLVYASGTLTYLPPQLRPEVFANYKQFTPVGGIHAFNVFVEKPFIATAPDWAPDEYFYRSGELLSYYWDWEILTFRESIFDCNSSGVPHRHAMDVMIARRVV